MDVADTPCRAASAMMPLIRRMAGASSALSSRSSAVGRSVASASARRRADRSRHWPAAPRRPSRSARTAGGRTRAVVTNGASSNGCARWRRTRSGARVGASRIATSRPPSSPSKATPKLAGKGIGDVDRHRGDGGRALGGRTSASTTSSTRIAPLPLVGLAASLAIGTCTPRTRPGHGGGGRRVGSASGRPASRGARGRRARRHGAHIVAHQLVDRRLLAAGSARSCSVADIAVALRGHRARASAASARWSGG
jgi:hypothetical protein